MASSTQVRFGRSQAAGVSTQAGGAGFVQGPVSKMMGAITSTNARRLRWDTYNKRRAASKVFLEAGGRLSGTILFNSTYWRQKPGACQPNIGVKKRVRRNESTIPNSENVGSYICRIDLAFHEEANAQRETDYRVFIEGVEVTAYVRGAMNWGLQGTGGMNSCSFDLNNTADAFIITPVNVCANLNTSGWRIDKIDLKRDPVIHNEPRYDELAKYLIYRKKFLRVNPGSKNAEIDSETGMWLYRLNPYSCIVSKFDCVRVFRRLGHISGTGIKFKTKDVYYDLWIPAFTGFVRSAPWKDNYVDGDRVVSVECGDYKWLMEGMRVRTTGLPLSGVGGASGSAVRKRPKSESDKLLDKSTGATGGGQILILSKRIREVANQQGFMTLLDELYRLRTQLGQAKCLKIDGTAKSNDYWQCFNKDLGGIPLYMKKFIDPLKSLENTFIVNADNLEKVAGVKVWLERDSLDYKEKIKKTIAQQKIAEQARLDAIDAAATKGPPQNVSSTTTRIIKKGQGGKVLYGTVTNKQLATLVKQGAVVLNKTTRQYEYNPTIKVQTKLDISWTKYAVQGITSASVEDIGAINITFPGNKGQASSDSDLLFALISYLQSAPLRRGESKLSLIKDQVKLAGLVDVAVANRIASSCSETTGKFIREHLTWVHKPALDGDEEALKNGRANFARGQSKKGKGPISLFGYLNNIVIPKIKSARKKLEEQIRPKLGELQIAIRKATESTKKEIFATKAAKKMGKDKFLRKLGSIEVDWRKKREEGKRKLTGRTATARNYAELIQVEPTFEKKQAGIFADLVKSINQNLHPLAGMSYEESVTWLCCAQSQVVPGVFLEIDSYQKAQARGQLENWNKTMLFGTFGRPLSYDEVTAVGALSDSNLKSLYSPINVFMHLLLPSSGTGARTIVQQEITKNTGSIPTFSYKSRKDLVDEISELLKYQWYVTPFGDIAFEFPHYNAMPQYWGKTFREAYTLEKEITGLSVNEDGDVPSAWVITGMEPEAAARVEGGEVIENQLYKIAITAPILIRRHGVKVEHINIAIPGVGAQVGTGAEKASGVESLVAWGLLHIQQQLGEAYQVNVDPFPERPYLLPNRPLWIIPRHKLCLLKSINYTFDSPNGPATVSVENGFSRWLFRDGTFRTVGGGKDPVINYAGIFTGEINYKTKEGVKTGGTTYKKGRQYTNAACAPALGRMYELSSAFSGDQISQSTQGYRYAPAGTVGTTKDSNGQPQTQELVLPPNATSPSNPALGHKTTKQALNPGEKKVPTANAARAGLRVQDRKPSKELDVYNIGKLFYDPYPYGEGYYDRSKSSRYSEKGGMGGRFNTWGFLRKQASYGAGSYKSRKGNLEVPFHRGVDIMTPRGKDIKAPVNLRGLQAYFCMGGVGGRSSKTLGWMPWKKRVVEKIQRPDGVETKIRYTRINGGEWEKFARYKNNQPVVKLGKGDILYLQYYKEMYRKFKQLQGSSYDLKVRVRRDLSARMGLLLVGYGDVQLPNAKGTKYEGQSVKAEFNFVHTDSLAVKNGRLFGMSIYNASANPEDPNQSDTIAYVGASGGFSDPHLHLEMAIYKGKTNDDIFQEVVKANNEYLTTQLQLKFSGGNPKGNELSPYWKKYFRGNRRSRGIKTVSDAIDYFVRHNGYFQEFVNPPSFAKKVWTNPLFFFKPEQIVPFAARYKKETEKQAQKLKEKQLLYNSQAHYERSGQLTSGAICQQATDADSKRLKTKYTQCVLKAKRETNLSSYRTLSRKLQTCADTLKKENNVLVRRLANMKTQVAVNEDKKLQDKLA